MLSLRKIPFSMIVIAVFSAMFFVMPIQASNTGGGGSSVPRFDAPGVDIADIYRQGIEQYSEGDFKAAERSLKKVTAVARKDANSHYVLGLSQIGLEKWRSAGRSLEKAVRYNEELYDARAELGFVYLKRDKLKDAEEQLAELQSSMITCASDCPESLEKAFTKLKTMMSPVDDNSVSLVPGAVQFSLAVAEFAYLDAVRLINLERYEEAIAQLEEAHMVYGPHPDVLTYLGFAHRMSGDSANAISFYEAALMVTPDHLNANEYLGEYFADQGNMVAAKAQLAKLENLCSFGCAQVDELRQWIAKVES